jgi:hypothetical protein
LLTTRDEIVERDSRDTSHFDVIDERHELVHDTLWEVGILLSTIL